MYHFFFIIRLNHSFILHISFITYKLSWRERESACTHSPPESSPEMTPAFSGTFTESVHLCGMELPPPYLEPHPHTSSPPAPHPPYVLYGWTNLCSQSFDFLWTSLSNTLPLYFPNILHNVHVPKVNWGLTLVYSRQIGWSTSPRGQSTPFLTQDHEAWPLSLSQCLKSPDSDRIYFLPSVQQMFKFNAMDWHTHIHEYGVLVCMYVSPRHAIWTLVEVKVNGEFCLSPDFWDTLLSPVNP